jgi:hypothetical protein
MTFFSRLVIQMLFLGGATDSARLIDVVVERSQSKAAQV